MKTLLTPDKVRLLAIKAGANRRQCDALEALYFKDNNTELAQEALALVRGFLMHSGQFRFQGDEWLPTSNEMPYHRAAKVANAMRISPDGFDDP